MSGLGPRFLDTLRKHLEIGTSLRHINMTDDQKHRVRICMELYNLLKQNPYLNKDEYLKNKYKRTYWEIRSDKECLDFIISVLDAGGKNISRMVVKSTYERAMRMAYDKGNEKEMISAAKHLSDLEQLTEPEQGAELESTIAKLPPVFTSDARKVLPGKTYSNHKQLEKIRSKWGVKQDNYQQRVESRADEILSEAEKNVGAPSEQNPSDNFDISSLDASQLEHLRAAVESRLAAGAAKSRTDICSDIPDEVNSDGTFDSYFDDDDDEEEEES